MPKKHQGEWVISETSTSTYSYHIRQVVDDKLHYGGGAPPAICGAKLAWDTLFPVKAWRYEDHLPSRWCIECTRIATEKGWLDAKS